MEKKIEQQQESLTQSTQWLVDGEQKLQLANDKLIEARRSNQDMANKLTYYKCEEDINKAEIETLKEQKRELIAKNNQHLLNISSQERNIMTVNQASEFFDQEKERIQSKLKMEMAALQK